MLIEETGSDIGQLQIRLKAALWLRDNAKPRSMEDEFQRARIEARISLLTEQRQRERTHLELLNQLHEIQPTGE